MGYPRARRAIKRAEVDTLPLQAEKDGRPSVIPSKLEAFFPFLSFHPPSRSGHDRLGFFPGVYGQSAGVRVGTLSSSRRGTRSRRGRRSCGDESVSTVAVWLCLYSRCVCVADGVGAGSVWVSTYMPQQTSSPSPPPRMLTGSAVICSAGFCEAVSNTVPLCARTAHKSACPGKRDWRGGCTYGLLGIGLGDGHLLDLGLVDFLGRHVE